MDQILLGAIRGRGPTLARQLDHLLAPPDRPTHPVPGRAFGGSVLTAALTHRRPRRHGRLRARVREQSAVTVAAYLSFAAPPDRGGSDYDLAQLLIQARALATLLGPARVEVYHGTAPLVQAVAQPLLPAELERLRREETTEWDGDAALAPLLDREGWEVVGAVRVARLRLEVPWSAWGLRALLLISLGFAASAARAVGKPAGPQRARVAYAAAALVAGCAAYLDVRAAAKRATDQWLAETRALVQEATTHAPRGLDVADVASIVRGGTLVPAAVAVRDPTPRRLNRGAVAALVVRMGAGRWAELRTRAAEAATGGWFLCTIALALLGPASVWIVTRSGGASPSPEPPRAGR
jgi:hypothetical protein